MLLYAIYDLALSSSLFLFLLQPAEEDDLQFCFETNETTSYRVSASIVKRVYNRMMLSHR